MKMIGNGNDRKATLQALHTDVVDKAVKSHERNVVLDGRPPLISSSERELTRKERPNPRSTKIRILYRSVQTVARRHMMSSSFFVCPLTRLQWYRHTYGSDRWTLSGNSAISRRETQIEMNMDWKMKQQPPCRELLHFKIKCSWDILRWHKTYIVCVAKLCVFPKCSVVVFEVFECFFFLGGGLLYFKVIICLLLRILIYY